MKRSTPPLQPGLDGWTFETESQVAEKLPGIHARIVRAWHSGPMPRACRHVLAGCPSAIISCGQHPDAGVWCQLCAADHAAGHTLVEELGCDECGFLGELVNPRLVIVPGERRVRGLDGRKRLVRGLFAVFGLGVCADCHRKAVGA